MMVARFMMGYITIAFALLSAGCATPTVVQSVKPGDNELSCNQLQNEFAAAQRARTNGEDAKPGLKGGDIVTGIIFFPALLVSTANANDAIAAADSRNVHLKDIMSRKNCPEPK